MGLSQNPIVARAQVVATRTKTGLGRMLSREPLPELITPEGVRISSGNIDPNVGKGVGMMLDESGSGQENGEVTRYQRNQNGDIILGNKIFKDEQSIIEAGFEELPPKSLDNLTARKWYREHVLSIPDQIDQTLPIEQKAKQAFELRNTYRTQTRDLMVDVDARAELDIKKPNPPFEELLYDKMTRKGLSREKALQDIYDTAIKLNKKYNKLVGME